MTCLDLTGQRSSKFRLLKVIFMTLFGISGTQLFPLMFHFLRLIFYSILDTQNFPPKSLPKQTSFVGEEIFQHDLNFNDKSSTIYTIQVILAGIMALFTGGTGIMAICREKLLSMKIYSLFMLLVTFITGIGSFSSPNLVSLKNLILPLLGGGMSSLISFVFSIITRKQNDSEHPKSAYSNYHYPYNA
ncbi:hypothetical protein NH340_JMT00156 [Sarcoptes scabiei]|nr:hypothetical protein QR98_0003790 [Sarcoptes scabiei]UXI14213.1 hypothetical protein NH340_JMT00156 [Sarcoptes scabiei]